MCRDQGPRNGGSPTELGHRRVIWDCVLGAPRARAAPCSSREPSVPLQQGQDRRSAPQGACTREQTRSPGAALHCSSALPAPLLPRRAVPGSQLRPHAAEGSHGINLRGCSHRRGWVDGFASRYLRSAPAALHTGRFLLHYPNWGNSHSHSYAQLRAGH